MFFKWTGLNEVQIEKNFCITWGSSEKQNHWKVCVCVCVYNKELAYAVMEAEKSQDLQLASWRPGRGDDVVLVWVQRPEKQESQSCKFQFKLEPEGRRRPVSQLKDSQAEREQILPYLSLFCSIQPFNWLGVPALGMTICFTQSTQFKY